MAFLTFNTIEVFLFDQATTDFRFQMSNNENMLPPCVEDRNTSEKNIYRERAAEHGNWPSGFLD